MIDRLRLIVYANPQANKPCFERIVDFDCSTSIPFESLRNDAKFLFGNNCKVIFEL